MISYKWKIAQLDCAVSEDGLSNVVKAVHWQYIGTDTDVDTGVETSGVIIGVTPLASPSSGSFTSYEDLTLETVSGWLESHDKINVDDMQLRIQNQISEKLTPTMVSLGLPTPPVVE